MPTSDVRTDHLFGSTLYRRFGRSKLATNLAGSRSSSCFSMSSRTCSVAVAVSAINGVSSFRCPEHAQVAIVGPELVPPLRYTVRLVHGYQADIYRVQEPLEPGLNDAFRRDVQQLGLTVERRLLDPDLLITWTACCSGSPAGTPLRLSASTWSFISAIRGRDH